MGLGRSGLYAVYLALAFGLRSVALIVLVVVTMVLLVVTRRRRPAAGPRPGRAW